MKGLIDRAKLEDRLAEILFGLNEDRMSDGCRFLIRLIRLLIETQPETETSDGELRKFLIDRIREEKKGDDWKTAQALENILQMWEVRKHEQR